MSLHPTLGRVLTSLRGVIVCVQVTIYGESAGAISCTILAAAGYGEKYVLSHTHEMLLLLQTELIESSSPSLLPH
jgi:hypothetical protein